MTAKQDKARGTRPSKPALYEVIATDHRLRERRYSIEQNRDTAERVAAQLKRQGRKARVEEIRSW